MIERRYTLRQESDLTWTVIDAFAEGVVRVKGRLLVFMTAAEARDAAALLNMVDDLKRSPPPVPRQFPVP